MAIGSPQIYVRNFINSPKDFISPKIPDASRLPKASGNRRYYLRYPSILLLYDEPGQSSHGPYFSNMPSHLQMS